MKLKTIFRVIKRAAEEHDRAVFAGIAIAGVFCTGILTVRATKKIIEKKPEIDAAETFKEKAVIVTKEAAPAAAAAVVTTTAIVLEHQSGSKKIKKLTKTIAALKNAYETSVTANEIYQAVVEEKTEPSVFQDIRKTFAKKMTEEQPTKTKEEPQESSVAVSRIVDTGYGKDLMSLNGHFFRASKPFVDGCFFRCYKKIYGGSEDYISQGELYSELGLSCIRTDEDDEWVWEPGRDNIEPRYESYVSDKFNEPITVISYSDAPHIRPKSLHR